MSFSFCCFFPPSTCFDAVSSRDNSWVCIGSTDGLYVIDLATSELQTAIYFTGTGSVCGGKNKHLPSHKAKYFRL